MFGIGLPEMILIMALALIVIGPDKLPDLARSLAKGLMELKKTAESLKTSFAEEGNPLDEIRPELEEAAKSLKNNLLDPPSQLFEHNSNLLGAVNPANMAAEAYGELMKQTGNLPNHDNGQTASNVPEKTEDNEVAKPEEAPTKPPETGINELQ
ncbi:MAG: twin-arginine translocase TatA/TatE family subunit [Pseudomonadota bacterium]